MSFVEILFLAVALAMDAFAVSLAAGTNKETNGFRPAFRLSFHFGFFQFLMPVLGWSLGTKLAGAIQTFDHWVAFGLLAFVGGRMIHAGWTLAPDAPRSDPSRGLTLVGLCVATSIDALAVGLSLAFLRVNIWYPSVVIGVVTATLSVIGLRLGNRAGELLGRRMEIIGGVLLCLIGLKILASHL
jgi:putative Mn2+ efflux pump MntP